MYCVLKADDTIPEPWVIPPSPDIFRINTEPFFKRVPFVNAASSSNAGQGCSGFT